MNCREAREWLPHYLNDELSASERELVQTHLARCEGCFDELRAMGATQRLVRTGLHVATKHVAPSAQAWSKLREVLQSDNKPKPALQHRPVFFMRAMGAAFAALSVMVGAAVLRPALVGNLAPASEATVAVSTQATLTRQAAQQEPAHVPLAPVNPDRRLLAAFLKTEPNQSVRSAIAMLTEPDWHGLDEFTCPTCARMQ
jgi:anti-sigma factor RsiW